MTVVLGMAIIATACGAGWLMFVNNGWSHLHFLLIGVVFLTSQLLTGEHSPRLLVVAALANVAAFVGAVIWSRRVRRQHSTPSGKATGQ